MVKTSAQPPPMLPLLSRIPRLRGKFGGLGTVIPLSNKMLSALQPSDTWRDLPIQRADRIGAGSS